MKIEYSPGATPLDRDEIKEGPARKQYIRALQIADKHDILHWLILLDLNKWSKNVSFNRLSKPRYNLEVLITYVKSDCSVQGDIMC